MREHKVYLGIDESNHGRFPQFYVAALTLAPPLYHEQALPKRPRREGHRHFPLHDWRYMPIDKKLREFCQSDWNLKIVAISSLIYSFRDAIEANGNYADITVDGLLRTREISAIMHLIKPMKGIIAAQPKADIHYSHVNEADFLAHTLFRLSQRRSTDAFDSHFSREVQLPNRKRYYRRLEEILGSA